MTQSTKRIGEGMFWLSLNGKKAEKVEHYSKLVGGGGKGKNFSSILVQCKASLSKGANQTLTFIKLYARQH